MDKSIGLIEKYRVERKDGAPLFWCFMLEDTDPLAIPALNVYADEAELAGDLDFATALRARIGELPRRRRADDEAPLWNGISQITGYRVERTDGKTVVWCLVLEDVDPLAKPALEGYASLAESAGYQSLADDLRAQLLEMPRQRERWELDPFGSDHDRFVAWSESR